MESNVCFSVIIPTYNRQFLLARAIESVLQQSFADFELWIIDDGSTDATEQAVQSFKDPRLHYKKIINSERGAARNAGIQSSSGRYVTFLDSDDFVYANHLEFVFLKLKELSFPECFHQGYVIINRSGKVVQKPYGEKNLNKALFKTGNIMSCMGVFVRRDILIHNLFNENRVLAGFEDWELWLRLASRFPIYYDPRITAVLTQHGERSTVLAERSRLEAMAKLFIELISRNPVVVTQYGRYMKALFANVYSYVSLHLSANKAEKREAWRFLLKSIKEDKKQLLRKRTIVILRNILLTPVFLHTKDKF